MDIQVPYNWERICYFASNENEQQVKSFMNDFETKNKATMNDETLSKIKSIFSTISISQKDVEETIKFYYENYKYILDPHTAVGVSGALKLKKNALCVATASPLKFDETIEKILGIKVQKILFKQVK
jgi:threonine synthase